MADKYNHYPEYVDPNFDVIKSECCNDCGHNFQNSGVVMNFNPICAHCSRCTFAKSDMYRKDGKAECQTAVNL